MKITIEFKSVEEYLEFKEKTAQEGRVQEQSICIEKLFSKKKNWASEMLSIVLSSVENSFILLSISSLEKLVSIKWLYTSLNISFNCSWFTNSPPSINKFTVYREYTYNNYNRKKVKDMEIGKRIQYTLAKKGIKSYKMAKEIGISQGNLYDILNGKNSNPTIKVLKKITDYLEITVDELIK